MIDQSALLPELLGTIGTTEGLFAGVDFHVIIQSGELAKVGIANLTFIGFLTCVGFEVIGEGALLREGPLTDGADKGTIGGFTMMNAAGIAHSRLETQRGITEVGGELLLLLLQELIFVGGLRVD